MFCPSCGLEVREGLRFCNHCGAQIVADRVAPPQILGLIWMFVIAAFSVAVLGLAVIFLFARGSMERGNILGSVLALLLMIALLTFGIVVLLLRQTSRLLTVYLQEGNSPQPQKGKLTQPRTAMLTEAQQTPARVDLIHETNPSNLIQQTNRVLQTNEEQQTRKFEANE